ncbi:MAG TPA: 4-alpha-glucanotransferase, partial [Syntrophorhabdaceae bacterium]|nr:4-alpha-glucanotransferase [Syntrophorhabdaceae bacterium]
MKLIFQLFCETLWGQEVYIFFPLKENDFLENIESFIKMDYTDNFTWTKEISILDTENLQFDYTYVIKNDNDVTIKEGIRKRNFSLNEEFGKATIKEDGTIIIKEAWIKHSDPSSLYFTSFFKEVISGQHKRVRYKHDKNTRRTKGSKRLIKFKVYAPWLHPDYEIAIAGDSEEFGGWDIRKSKHMDYEGKGIWCLEVLIDNALHLDYKYIIKDKAKDNAIWEQGKNRHLDVTVGDLVLVNDGVFRYKDAWRGAGICIPVFSIRTEKGFGTGEFSDLKPLADWASNIGFKVIQILPVNDTTRQHSWTDAYPYSCISAFALHPLYLSIEEIGDMPEGLRQKFSKRREELNSYEYLEYEMVMAAKMDLARKLFELDNMKFLASDGFNGFFQKNAFWLKPYALFCALRDKYKTGDYSKWGAYKKINIEDMERLVSRESEFYRDVCFYYFIQYHLHRQLYEASQYAKAKGIALKGDIPIGLHPESHEIWAYPDLFNIDKSAGAPPDAFSEHGQNWGFPTYNWEGMAEDNYLWWRRRLKNMSQFFQLIRLDHILGFFRIWEIPQGMYSGMMGRFNPAIPVTEEELKKEGLEDIDRLCEPYITPSIIKEIFGDLEHYVWETFLVLTDNGSFRLKPEFSNQKDMDAFLNALQETRLTIDKEFIRDGLFKLISNRILLKDEKGGLHFRFNMFQTPSFNALEKWQQDKLIAMYNDYFYRR